MKRAVDAITKSFVASDPASLIEDLARYYGRQVAELKTPQERAEALKQVERVEGPTVRRETEAWLRRPGETGDR